MIAGFRVVNGANLPKQFHEALSFAQSKFSQNDRVAAMELDVERIDGFPLHRVQLTPPDRPGQFMFGKDSHLYAYASTQALWLAFGGEEALKALKVDIEATKKPVSTVEDRRPRVPFVFQTRAKQWVEVQSEVAATEPEPPVPQQQNPARARRRAIAQENAAKFREEVKASFDDQNDGLRAEVRPTDNGVRVHLEFQSGWLAMLGRSIALQMERTAPVAAEPPTTTAAPTPLEN